MNYFLRTPAVLALMLLLAACQKTDEVPTPTPTGSVMQGVAATPASDAATLRLVDAAGKVPATFKPDSLEVTFREGDKIVTLHGKTRDDGKRKYARPGEGEVMEVKTGEDGFKLRGADSHLLWKIKLKDNGIKVSDNEENTKPITLEIKDGRIQIADNGKPLGEASFDGDKARAKVTDASGKEVATVQTKKNSAAFALQLATRISAAERAVLALELLARDL